MPLSLPNKDKKKKKIDEVEERLSPKKVSDLSFSEARAIREQYGSLKNYELATDKNRAKRIDEQMQDLSARRFVDAATARGTPVQAESFGKNNKWNDYATVMGERKTAFDIAADRLKRDLDAYSGIYDTSAEKRRIDAMKTGYDNAIALGKSAADFGNQFKSADDFKRWSIGWDGRREGDKTFVDDDEKKEAREEYYKNIVNEIGDLVNQLEFHDYRGRTQKEIQDRIDQLTAEKLRYERFDQVSREDDKLRSSSDFAEKSAFNYSGEPTNATNIDVYERLARGNAESGYGGLTDEEAYINSLAGIDEEGQYKKATEKEKERTSWMNIDPDRVFREAAHVEDTPLGVYQEGDTPIARYLDEYKKEKRQKVSDARANGATIAPMPDNINPGPQRADESFDIVGEYILARNEETDSNPFVYVGGNLINILDYGDGMNLDFMTEDDLATYRYVLNTQGATAAKTWLDNHRDIFVRRADAAYREKLKDESALGLAARSIASVPENLAGGIGAFIGTAFGDGSYDSTSWMQRRAEGARAETAQRIDKATGDANLFGFSFGDVYQSLMSGADSLAGATLLGKGYTYVMGTGAAASKARTLYEQGATEEQIHKGAFVAGLTEILTEKVSAEVFFSNFMQSTTKSGWQGALKVATQAFTEGTEEMASDALNAVFDNIIRRSQSDWNQTIQKALDEGKTRKEAERLVWTDFANQLWQSFAGGALSGGMMAGPGTIASGIEYNRATKAEGNYIIDSEGVEALRNIANEMTGAPKSVSKLIEKTGKKPTAKNVGRLSRAVGQNVAKNADAESRFVQGAKFTLAREGVDLSDVKAREGTNLYNNVDVSDKISDIGTTVETETGGEVTIDEKNPITQRNGKTYLNTSAGEILQDDIKYSSEKEAQLYEYVSDLPQSVANAIVENYKGQDNVRGYVNGMRDGILLYGYNNIENAPKNTAFATLDKADQQYARQIGQSLATEDLNVKPQTVGNHVAVKETATTSGERVMNLSEIGLKATPAVAKKIGAGGTAGAVYTKGDVDLNSAMGRADGLLAYVYSSIAGNSVVLYDSKTVKDADLKNSNGKHVASDGTIYLDIRAEAGNNVTGGIAYTLGHEMTHEAEQWAKKEYAAFRKFLYENYIEKGTAVEDLIAKKMSDLEITDRAYAESEVVADACERMLLDSDAMEKLSGLQDKDPGTFKKIVDFIKRALEKIVGKFNSIREVYETMGAENTRIESKLVQEFGDNLQKLQDMWSDMVVTAAQNRTAAVEHEAKQTAKTTEQYSKKLSEDEYARYMELAKDPVKNEAELSQMVESAARDAGYTSRMWHGAKDGKGFTKFKDWSYFTEDREYAEKYTDRNPDNLYGVYVKMEHPFDTRTDEKARQKFEDARGEYGMSELDDTGLPDWTDGYDIVDFIEENGLDYDGVALDEGAQFHRQAESYEDRYKHVISYVVKNSAQVKSADPVTYDDQGNIIPLEERFNEEKEDIRYSRKSSESYAVRDIVNRALKRLDPSSAEYRAMAKYKAELDTLDNMRAQLDEAIKSGDRQAQTRLTNNIKTQRGILNRIENSASMKNVASMRDVTRLADDAKKLREMLKLQSRETGGTIAKQRSVNAAASEIMEKYGIKRGKGELAELLGNYYTKMMQSVNNETMTREAALDQAREAAEWIARHVPDEIQYDDGAIEALDMLRGYKVKLNDNQRQNIRAKYDSINGWRRAVGGYITLSNEGKYLDELWPEWAERAPGYFTNEIISDADMPERLAEIIDSLKKSRETAIEVPGQYEYDLDRAANDVYEAFWNIEPEQTVADKYAERIKTLKAEHLKLMSDMRKSFRDTIREETREAYREGKQKAREYTRKIEVRRKVKKLAERLYNIYDKPKVNKYVPVELAKPTVELLKELDFETGRASKLAEKFGNLKLQYDAMMKGDEGKATYPQEISDLIEKMRTEVKGMAVKDMSADQLEDIYTTLKAFDHVLKTAREARNLSSSIGEDMTIYEAGEKWINEISETKEAKSVINKYTQQMLTPREFFERLASYKKNSISEKVFDMLNRAERKQAEIEMRSNMIFDDIMKNVKYLSQLSSTKNLVDIGLKDSDGNAVPITRGMMLAYYMHTLNEDNARHVAIGGMKAPDLKQYYKGDADSYSNGKRIPGLVGAELAAQYEKIHDTLEGKRNKDGTRSGGLNEELQDAMDRNNSERVEELLEQRNQLWAERDEIIARGMRMIDQQRQAIEEMLTDEDKAFIKATQDYFENYSKDVLNEATMQMYGFEKARVENYFPIHSDANFLKAAFETVTNDASLENKGFMKDRVKAANPIMLEDFSSVINSQIQKTAQYAAFAPILREFNKLYSVKTGGVAAVDSVMGAIDEKFGQAGTKYISNLVADMNGARRKETTFLDRARSNFAGAVLTLNPRVSMVQAASYPTAAAVVGYKALAKALAMPDGSFLFKRANTELISKYTARLWQRNRGGADVTLHDAKSVNSLYNKVNSRLKFLTGWIEAVDAGTVGRLWYAAEYYVRDNFKNLERGTDEYYEKTAEVFNEIVERTQPNYTTLQRPEILRDPRQLVRSLTMFMTQRLQNANILYGAARKYAKYSSDLKTNKNGVTKEDVRQARGDLARAVSSQIVSTATIAGMKLLADALLHNFKRRKDDETGEVTAGAIWGSVLNDFLESFASDFIGGSEAYSAIHAIITGGKFYGPSIGGVETITEAAENIVKLAQKIKDPDQKPKANDFIKIGFAVANLFGVPAENASKIGGGLWNHAMDIKNGEFGSFNAGDEPTKKKILRRMTVALAAGNDKAFDELLKEYGDNAVEDFRKEVGDEYKAGELDRETAKEYLMEHGEKSDGEAEKQLDKWDYAAEHGTSKGYSMYDNFNKAVRTGKDLKKTIKDYYERYGVSPESMAGEITNYFKPLYVATSNSERAKMQGYLLNAYELLGYDRDKKKKDIAAWIDPAKQKDQEENDKAKDEKFAKRIKNW